MSFKYLLLLSNGNIYMSNIILWILVEAQCLNIQAKRKKKKIMIHWLNNYKNCFSLVSKFQTQIHVHVRCSESSVLRGNFLIEKIFHLIIF